MKKILSYLSSPRNANAKEIEKQNEKEKEKERQKGTDNEEEKERARVSAAAAAVTTDADEANTASAARKAALIAAAAPTLGASLAFAIALVFSASRAYDDEITAMGTWRYAWSFCRLIVCAATAALPAPPARPRGASESETLGEPVSPPAAPSPVVTRAAVAAVTLDAGLRCASHVGVVVAAAARSCCARPAARSR